MGEIASDKFPLRLIGLVALLSACGGQGATDVITADTFGSAASMADAGAAAEETNLGTEDAGLQAPSYPLTPTPYTTLQAVWRPVAPSDETMASIQSGELSVSDLNDYEAAGLGVVLEQGNPWIERRDLAPEYDGANPGTRRSLLYLWQSADSQLIDEESPIRLEAFPALYRPQGHLTIQVFEAHVRTARALNGLSGRPFDLAVIAGDITDGSQLNEFQWFFTTLNGGVVDPDSGVDDDPVPGPGNDYNDPFLSAGLEVPWYAALGNHETLYNGGFGVIDEPLREAAAGSEVYEWGIFPNGFRDGSTTDAAVVEEGSTPADANRVPQRLGEALQLLYEAGGQPEGHGLSADDVAANRGYFSAHPLQGKPIRLITLHTVNPEAGLGIGAQGFMDDDQLAWLQAELADADAAHELIVVMSHHRVEDIAGSSPVSGEEIAMALADSDGAVLHLTGHGHQNEAGSFIPQAIEHADFGYWQLMLSSTVDFPMHTRIIEIVDEDNGYVSVYVTNIGHNSPPGTLAHQGRALAAGALSFAGFHSTDDVDAYWQDDVRAQNLLLRIPIPSAIRDELSDNDWPTRIESEETLLPLVGPDQQNAPETR